MNPRLTNKGSSPSPCAHLWESSVCFKTDACRRETKVVKAGTRGRRLRHVNAAALISSSSFARSSSSSSVIACVTCIACIACIDKLINLKWLRFCCFRVSLFHAQKQQKPVFKSASMKISNDRFVCTLCGKTGHNVLECGWRKENLLYTF